MAWEARVDVDPGRRNSAQHQQVSAAGESEARGLLEMHPFGPSESPRLDQGMGWTTCSDSMHGGLKSSWPGPSLPRDKSMSVDMSDLHDDGFGMESVSLILQPLVCKAEVSALMGRDTPMQVAETKPRPKWILMPDSLFRKR